MGTKLGIGTRVRVTEEEKAGWAKFGFFPKGEVTGTITKIFKNGKRAVSVDQLPNKSKDGKATLYFKAEGLAEL